MGKTAKWRNFTRQEIEEFVQESFSYATLSEKLGYNKRSGGNITAVKSMISELDIDVSHCFSSWVVHVQHNSSYVGAPGGEIA